MQKSTNLVKSTKAASAMKIVNVAMAPLALLGLNTLVLATGLPLEVRAFTMLIASLGAILVSALNWR